MQLKINKIILTKYHQQIILMLKISNYHFVIHEKNCCSNYCDALESRGIKSKCICEILCIAAKATNLKSILQQVYKLYQDCRLTNMVLTKCSKLINSGNNYENLQKSNLHIHCGLFDHLPLDWQVTLASPCRVNPGKHVKVTKEPNTTPLECEM